MSRDGLVPAWIGKLWEARKTPVVLTLSSRCSRGCSPRSCRSKSLAELVNIGTLFAFLVVNVGVIVLRRTSPDLDRGFRVPFVPLFPIIGAALCVYLMTKLPWETWERFGIWLAIGLVLYFLTGAGTRDCALANLPRPWPRN